jgi:hypothetical protein
LFSIKSHDAETGSKNDQKRQFLREMEDGPGFAYLTLLTLKVIGLGL